MISTIDNNKKHKTQLTIATASQILTNNTADEYHIDKKTDQITLLLSTEVVRNPIKIKSSLLIH